MLYDPKWEVQTKADPFTLASLIAWLETMPADGPYCYSDHGLCMMGQYLTHHGFNQVVVYSNGIFLHGPEGERQEYPYLFNQIALYSKPRTFGSALGNARKYAAGGRR